MSGGKKLFTIILPCLNEGQTLLQCVEQINNSLKKGSYKNDYDILVCDNGSTDDSVSICKKHKIPYIIEEKRGYGNALLAGISAAKTKYVVMLDCDLSYKTDDIPTFIDNLKSGNDFVIGNRFKGKIEVKAMPISHRIGSRFLTHILNLFFFTKCHDCHCGLRAFDRKKVLSCELKSSGFEFASEMIIGAKRHKLKMIEVPTSLSKDGRDHKSHLRTLRDGFRHLHLINTCKFRYSKIFRYLATFILTAFLAFSFGFCSNLIPHEAVEKNLKESIYSLSDKFSKRVVSPIYERYEKYGDMRDVTTAYFADTSHPLDATIEMKYLKQCDDFILCPKFFELNNIQPTLNEYSRYWHGQSSLVRYSSPFMTLDNLLLFLRIVVIILFIVLVYKLFKKDKLIAVAFFLSCFSGNIFFTTTSIQFVPVILLMLISSLLALRLYEKQSRYLDILFLVTGILTCYFDFFTAETITLAMPLVFVTYFEIKEHGKMSFKKIFLYILLWGLGYSLMWGLKWFIDYLHFGPKFIDKLFRYIRTNPALHQGGSKAVYYIFLRNLAPWLPFGLFTEGAGLLAFFLAVILIFNIIRNRKYLPLILVSLVPVIRFALIQSHSYGLSFMTYRALLGMMTVAILTVFIMIRDFLVVDPVVHSRGRSVKGSKGKSVL